MTILGKPAAGTYQFDPANFGANNTPAPDSYYHLDEGSGTTLENIGKDSGSFDGTVVGADWDTVSGSAVLSLIKANLDRVTFPSTKWGITAYPFTVALVVENQSGAAHGDTFFNLSTSTSTTDYYLLNTNFGGTLGDLRQHSHVGGGQQQNILSGSEATLHDGNYHLLVEVWESATRRTVYLDGALKQTATTSVAYTANPQTATLGAFIRSTGTEYATFRVASFAVWKGSALTDAQVQTDLWNGGEPYAFLGPAAIEFAGSFTFTELWSAEFISVAPPVLPTGGVCDTHIVAFVVNGETPAEGLADLPQVTVREVSSPTIEGTFEMLDVGGGHYWYKFTTTLLSAFAYEVDADPNVTGQVPAKNRYYSGAFSCVEDDAPPQGHGGTLVLRGTPQMAPADADDDDDDDGNERFDGYTRDGEVLKMIGLVVQAVDGAG